MTRSPGRLALGLALGLALAGCGERPPNVLVIVIDTLRADHLGAYGYARDTTPTLDRVAAEGTRFDAALVTSSWSPPSHTSIVTGLPSERHGVHRWSHALPASAPTLAERLAARGFRTGLFSSHGGIRKGVPDFDRGFEERVGKSREDDAEVIARAAAWTQAAREPWYAHVILMGAHHPYDQYPAEWNTTLFTDLVPGGERELPPARPRDGIADLYEIDGTRQVGEYVNRYDRALHQLDARVGELLAGLAQRGRLDRTLVVVTSDHGESLGERQHFGHSKSLYEHLIRVPLLVRLPGRVPAGGVWREPVSLVDLVPSVLGAVGAPASAELPGVDLHAHLRAGTRPPSRLLTAAIPLRRTWLVMVRKDDQKLLYDGNRDRYQLYDLARDPGEHDDLLAGGAALEATAPPELVAGIQALTATLRDARVERAAPKLAPDAEETLRALGYLEPESPQRAD